MNYQHSFVDGRPCSLPAGKAVCVGRNYAEHAKELNNPVPDAPLLFMKPATSFAMLAPAVAIPSDTPCHHELEISLLIGRPLTKASADDIRTAVIGVGLGLDLTLRDRQQMLKAQGHPWEMAKAFDGALPLSAFVVPELLPAWTDLRFSLDINGQRRQRGHSADMLTPIVPLLVYLTRYFTLMPGDVVMTGTPSGVAQLHSGDQLHLELNDQFFFDTQIL